MLSVILRLVLVAVLVVGIAAYFFGYRQGGGGTEVDRPAGTSGAAGPIDTTRARETGARVGEAVARGANEAEQAAADGAMTAKIKAKMALDDRVQAAKIDVDTAGSVVTLSGNVSSEDERSRAVQLARDTDGVTSVIDHLVVR